MLIANGQVFTNFVLSPVDVELASKRPGSSVDALSAGF